MSTKKKTSPTGVRYTDAQKKEVVAFVADYNSANGRGGQSAAAKKFKVTPLTIAAWIKAAGKPAKAGKAPAAKAVKAVKAAKPAKAVKAAKPAKGPVSGATSKKGMRYTPAQKQEVIDFVNSYNAANGRGGQSQAAKKYDLSVLTVSAWLKKSGSKAVKGGAAKAVKAVPSSLTGKIASLIEVGDQLRKAESETEKLRAKYDALRSAIQALI